MSSLYSPHCSALKFMVLTKIEVPTHAHRYTYTPKPQKVKLLWVSVCYHDTADPESVPNLTINQQTNHTKALATV